MPPEVSVVVPSHERPWRLRWLLAALEDQTLSPDRFEVVVVHDSAGEETEALLAAHALRAGGVLSHLRLPPGTGSPARQRNVGWRAARAPLVAFTDDDCRPDPAWLEELLAVAAAAAAAGRAVVQGATRPDPYESAVLAAPRARTISVEPPGRYVQTCNVLYPRALLEELGGFDEAIARAGEDTDLFLRAQASGAELVPAPGALVFHAIEALSLPALVRLSWRWQDLVLVFRRHPPARKWLIGGVFWRPEHVELGLAVAGLARARRRPVRAALALPYLHRALGRRGTHPRGRARAAAELPGAAVVHLAEIVALARGSVRHRTLVL